MLKTCTKQRLPQKISYILLLLVLSSNSLRNDFVYLLMLMCPVCIAPSIAHNRIQPETKRVIFRVIQGHSVGLWRYIHYINITDQ